jgi:LPXTG-motif cell wall-anchored protein
LLNLLGLTLNNLPISDVLSLLGQLGEIDAVNTIIGTTNFSDPTDIQADIDTLNAGIDSAQATLDTANAALTAAQSALDLCLLGNPLLCSAQTAARDAAQAAVTAAQTTVDAVQAELTTLLQTVVNVLTQTPLLSVGGVKAGAFATAADTVANSTASVVGSIDHVMVGGLDLGAVDVAATLDQASALLDSVMTDRNNALTVVDPSLANILSIKLFDHSTDVSQAGDYVQSLANVTALAVTITPPNICDLVNSVFDKAGPFLPNNLDLPTDPVTDALTDLGSGVADCFTQVVPTVRGASVQASVLPEGTLAALTGPITLTTASVSSAATFKAAATPETPATPQLPRTGMNETLLLVVGGLMAAAALGLRRITSPATVRSRRK